MTPTTLKSLLRELSNSGKCIDVKGHGENLQKTSSQGNNYTFPFEAPHWESKSQGEAH
jgi:hypothetical protein